MAEIMTVLGPIAPEELGFTSMHEHILYDGQCFRRRFGNLIPPDPPVKLDDPVTLHNLGMLKHGFIMSDDAIREFLSDVDDLGVFTIAGESLSDLLSIRGDGKWILPATRSKAQKISGAQRSDLLERKVRVPNLHSGPLGDGLRFRVGLAQAYQRIVPQHERLAPAHYPVGEDQVARGTERGAVQ